MFLEKLRLQLFAADENDNPDDGGQDEDETIEGEDDEIDSVDDDEETADDEDDEDESEDEESQEETEGSEDDSDKPFMVFKSKDEHQKYMDNVIGKRLGEQRDLKKKLDEQEGIISILQEHFGVSDFEELKKKSDELLDDIAYKKGTTKDELKKQQEQLKRIKEFEAMQQEQMQQAFFNAFNADCEKLSKSNPDLYGDINPDELIENKQFLAMLGSGVPFKQAYDALNVEKLLKKQTQKAKKTVIEDVKAKGNRISENATKKSKAAVTKIDVSKMTDEQLADIERRAAAGERITF